jgi:hypothetical protein
VARDRYDLYKKHKTSKFLPEHSLAGYSFWQKRNLGCCEVWKSQENITHVKKLRQMKENKKK